jgi:hypothetical protein
MNWLNLTSVRVNCSKYKLIRKLINTGILQVYSHSSNKFATVTKKCQLIFHYMVHTITNINLITDYDFILRNAFVVISRN